MYRQKTSRQLILGALITGFEKRNRVLSQLLQSIDATLSSTFSFITIHFVFNGSGKWMKFSNVSKEFNSKKNSCFSSRFYQIQNIDSTQFSLSFDFVKLSYLIPNSVSPHLKKDAIWTKKKTQSMFLFKWFFYSLILFFSWISLSAEKGKKNRNIL